MNSKPRLDPAEVEFNAIRAQGSGGQNVNKVSSAIHARFDIRASSLPEAVKARLLTSRDQRISDDGVLVVKAQSHRTQHANKLEALERIQAIIDDAAQVRAPRRPTRPGRGAVMRRLEAKQKRSRLKATRRSPPQD
ncbi:MAG: aminoacyl-tRNA hydrolase [Gammaproteobacteria bacterium]|nr:aminoacyl-tRNA hydrolase [Gammaproteobacteria bacterium]